jgi:hypothetical protein
MRGDVGFHGDLEIRVIRGDPNLRRRVMDAIAAFIRRIRP